VTSDALILAMMVIGFSLIVAPSLRVGDRRRYRRVEGRSKAIARQPEARPNIFTFFFLGVGILEAFPIIGLGLGLYLFFAVTNVPAHIQAIVSTIFMVPRERAALVFLQIDGTLIVQSSTSSSSSSCGTSSFSSRSEPQSPNAVRT